MASTEALIGDGIKAYEETRYDDAARIFRHAGRRDDADISIINYYLGLISVRNGEYDKAIDYLKKMISMDIPRRKARHIRQVLGYIYAQKEEYEIAETFFQTVLNMDFNDPATYSALGYCQYKLGRPDEALKNFEEALAIDENNANALNSFGFVSAELNNDLEQAVKTIKKAIEQNPSNPAYMDSMGWALFKKGDTKRGKDFLAAALERLPDNDEVKSHFKKIIVNEIKQQKDTID